MMGARGRHLQIRRTDLAMLYFTGRVAEADEIRLRLEEDSPAAPVRSRPSPRAPRTRPCAAVLTKCIVRRHHRDARHSLHTTERVVFKALTNGGPISKSVIR